MSNHHVFFKGGPWENKPVFQTTTASMCSLCLGDVIGFVMRGDETVDAAIAALKDNVDCEPEIVEIGPVTGTHTITLADLLAGPYQVRKRGWKTGLTAGIVSEIHSHVDISPDPNRRHVRRNVIVTEPTGSVRFSCEGDSGSVILHSYTQDNQVHNEVVGLHFSGFGGAACAIPIGDVENALRIRVVRREASTVTDLTQGPAGATAPVSGEMGLTVTGQQQLLRRAHQEILGTPEGKRYTGLVLRHQEEVRTLIDSNKRVAAIWYRSGGPTILQKLIQALDTPNIPLPSVIDGQSLADCLNRIFAIFKKYGSPSLRSDIDLHGPAIVQLGGLSYRQFLARLHASNR